MKVKLNSIAGIDDAICTMFISRHTWTEELDEDIRNVVNVTNDRLGRYIPYEGNETYYQTEESRAMLDRYNEWMEKLCKWGKFHITMLRFIDFSVTVRGLHRAGQDDWDSHAKRFENRIIRNSTRFESIRNENNLHSMSDFYADKVLTTDAALSHMYPSEKLKDILPDEIECDGKTFVKTFNGYIAKEFENNQDVKRGLYNLGFPSDFLFRCNLTEFSHVYKERNAKTNANPEVKELAEAILTQLHEAQPRITQELLLAILN